MIIKSLEGSAGFRAGDASFLRELLHPAKEPLDIGYSLAHAAVEPGAWTLPHRLAGAEVYYVLEGTGRMRVGDEEAPVAAGDAVYIPPGALQSIGNTGPGRLSFLCIVDPAWRAADEEIL
ncbi:MAG TPA: cupin domain-containing protein [Candidatus Aminicenantes bacterium]|nr:cupin domain-containing protein [Candidatus Aminicenantes bacterium]